MIIILSFWVGTSENKNMFVFYVFHCNLKEKGHIIRNINSKKKKKCLLRKIIIIIRVGWACATQN